MIDPALSTAKTSALQQPTRVDFRSAGGVTIAAYRWDPVGEPRAIAQIAHGVGEHALRYSPLATHLAARGFVVYTHDHRGHGATLLKGQEPGAIGEDGWAELVTDIGRMALVARNANPALELALIAHSLGSYACQQYLLTHSAEFDVVAMSGTAALDMLEPAMDLDAPLDLAMFNAAFEPARTEFDWLSRDENQVDAYIADPLCGFGLNITGTKALFAGGRRTADPALLTAMRSDLPIYVTVGRKDPVNADGALAQLLVDRYRQAGLTNVTLKIWEEARHEVFNETNRYEIFADLFSWLDAELRQR